MRGVGRRARRSKGLTRTAAEVGTQRNGLEIIITRGKHAAQVATDPQSDPTN